MSSQGVSTFQERLQTFKDAHPVKRRGSTAKKRAPVSLKWPHKTPTAQDLAQAGFYFHPSASSPDNVRCFSCEVNLDGWESEDDPILEHYAHRSDCAWAMCRYVKRKFEDEGIMDEDPMSEVYANARKATFEGWPHESKRGWKCKIEKMVEAGWHYDPSPDMEDGVTCAYCSTELGGWERKDDPFEEHLKRGTDCPFFALCDTFASNRPTKAKRARTSKATRTSTQSSNLMPDMPVDADISLATTEAAEDETVMSTTSKSVKATKGRKRAGTRSTKADTSQLLAAAEPLLVSTEEVDLGASTASQPARKQRSRKKAAGDDSILDVTDFGASVSQPKRKTKAKKNEIDQSEIRDATLGASTTTAPKPTRRKASKQALSQEVAVLADPEPEADHERLVEETETFEPAMVMPKVAASKKSKKTKDEQTSQEEMKTSASTSKAKKQARGTKRTSDGEAKSLAPQIRMSALDRLDSSVMMLDEVPHIFEDSPDKPVKRSKKQSSIRQPLQELEPIAPHRVSDMSMLRSSNMHEAETSTPRMTPEAGSDAASEEPPTPTPARHSLSVIKRASMMRAGMRPSATPLPSKTSQQPDGAATPASSPQSSDAENKPPSARPNIRALQLQPISPLRKQDQPPHNSTTPAPPPLQQLSPSKRTNLVSRIHTHQRWTPADLDAAVFQPHSPTKLTTSAAAQAAGDKENLLLPAVLAVLDTARLDGNDDDDGAAALARTVQAVRACVGAEERGMTVEQWLKHTGRLAGERLRGECETMVTLFEREGARAMRVLEAIQVAR